MRMRKRVCTTGFYQGAITALRGMSVEITRRTPTGTVVCRVIERRGAYEVDDVLHLQPYEIGGIVTYQVLRHV